MLVNKCTFAIFDFNLFFQGLFDIFSDNCNSSDSLSDLSQSNSGGSDAAHSQDSDCLTSDERQPNSNESCDVGSVMGTDGFRVPQSPVTPGRRKLLTFVIQSSSDSGESDKSDKSDESKKRSRPAEPMIVDRFVYFYPVN